MSQLSRLRQGGAGGGRVSMKAGVVVFDPFGDKAPDL